MKKELTDNVRVSHVLDAIGEIERYLKGVGIQDFLDNSDPEIKWKEINGFRNISIHEYFGVDNQIVWQIAQDDLPILKEQFDKAIKGL